MSLRLEIKAVLLCIPGHLEKDKHQDVMNVASDYRDNVWSYVPV